MRLSNNNFVNDLKSSVKLSEVVRKYINFSNHSGKKFYIECPFHNEKSPSCVVQDDIGLFHCFGCGASGDLITFVEKIENIQFLDACKKIADWFNIKYSFEKKSDSNLNHTRSLNNWFTNNLKNNLIAHEYLKSRGLTDQTISTFEIGWIPEASSVLNFCSKNNISNEIMLKIGFKDSLLKIFQNRIVFPIYVHNKVCGFGARYITKRFGPKYINSPETEYFKKSEILYGTKYVDKYKPIVLVEGYMDVVVMHQFGCNAVAALGTAISYNHVKQIFNMGQEAIICLDGDEAGLKSMKRIIELVLPHLDEKSLISFIILPDKEDPDSFLFKYGKEKWDQLQEKRISLVKACWDLFLNKSDIPETQYKYYKQVIELGNTIKNSNIRELYKQKWRELWKSEIIKYKKYGAHDRSYVKKPIPNLQSTYEKILVGMVLKNPKIYDYICDDFLNLELSKDIRIMQDLIPQWIKKGEHNLDFFEQTGSTDIVDLCLSDDIMQVAPFMFSEQNKDYLVKMWQFIFNKGSNYGKKAG